MLEVSTKDSELESGFTTSSMFPLDVMAIAELDLLILEASGSSDGETNETILGVKTKSTITTIMINMPAKYNRFFISQFYPLKQILYANERVV